MSFFNRHGFETHQVVCDGASSNVSFIRSMCHLSDDHIDPWCMNPFTRRRLYFMIDPVHQMKSMRNALWSSSPDRKRNFFFKGDVMSWTVLEEIRERDELRSIQGHWKQVPKLTDEVVNLTNWSKMRVHLALVVFSERTRAELKTYLQSSFDDTQARGTLRYLDACAGIFDILLLKEKIETPDDARFAELRAQMIFFEEWRAEQLAMLTEGTTRAKADKCFLATQTWMNLRILVNAWIPSMQDFLRRNPNSYIIPNRLTQSMLESIFGRVRGMCGGDTNPTVQGARRALGAVSMLNELNAESKIRGSTHTVVGDVETNLPVIPLRRQAKKRKLEPTLAEFLINQKKIAIQHGFLS